MTSSPEHYVRKAEEAERLARQMGRRDHREALLETARELRAFAEGLRRDQRL